MERILEIGSLVQGATGSLGRIWRFCNNIPGCFEVRIEKPGFKSWHKEGDNVIWGTRTHCGCGGNLRSGVCTVCSREYRS